MSSDIDENIFKFDELAAASPSNQIQRNTKQMRNTWFDGRMYHNLVG